MEDSSPGVIPKSSLFTITLRSNVLWGRDGHLYCHILIFTHWPSTRVNEMSWFWEGQFQLSLKFDGEQKNETKQGMLEEQTTVYWGLPIWGTWEATQLPRIPWRYLTKRGGTCDKGQISFDWLITSFIYKNLLTMLGAVWCGGIQWEVKIGVVHDSQSL